jgi:amino acid adenylation domain-containing protein
MKNVVLEPQKIHKDLEYWKNHLASDYNELNLPYDYPRPSTPNPSYKMYNFRISRDSSEVIDTFCEQENVTPYTFFLTLLNTLLFRYSGEEDIRVGALEKNYNHLGLTPFPELFDNTLVIRTQIHEEITFKELLHEVSKVTNDAYNHRSIPFSLLPSEVNSPDINKNNTSFFQVMFILDNTKEKSEMDHFLQCDEWKNKYKSSFVDLNLIFTQNQSEFNCTVIYNEEVFEEETIKRMEGHINCLLYGALHDPNTEIGLLPLITDNERYQLLVEWNKNEVVYPRNSSIPELFEEQAGINPDNIAIFFENEKITYRELNERANQIANYLRILNIGQEELVAICLKRSPDMIASFLGVLKAGGAYVPIDLSYPKDRIAYMLEDSEASFVITTEDIAKELPGTNAKVIYLDKESAAISTQPRKNIQSNCRAESLAYVMYTSGSTGKPKGVAIVHRGIVRLIKNITYANLGMDETILNRAPIAFDASVFEIYGTLLNGGKLAIMNSQKPTFKDIADAIQQYQVTTLRSTPGILNMLLEEYSDNMGSLRQVLSAGEALPVWLAQKFFTKLPKCKLINAYGPTENSVSTTSYHVKGIPPDTSLIPIGRPISNDSVYILDKYLQPVPIGVIGEIYMSGDGIARGYWNKPEITKERFPSDPFNNTLGKRLYKSGDLARYRTDGNIEYIGRADGQVKIRGYRIELGEIESFVGLYPGVKQAVAGTIKGKDGTEELVAYVVMNKKGIFNQQLIRSFVGEKLPQHMIPTFFVELQEIPVTPVGKIDRKKLPAPTVTTSREQIVLPRSQVERKLVILWENILGISPIGIKDSYFELGGNSLLAMQIFTEIEKVFNKKLPASIIFQEDTIEKLAKQIEVQDAGTDLQSSIVAIQPHGVVPPLFCIHGGGGEVLVYQGLAKELGNERPVYGLRYTNGVDDLSLTVESLAEKYIQDIKRVQPNGPYFLLGYCFGGVIAYEMAQMLVREGQEVSFLAILNFANPRRKQVEIKDEISYKKIISKNIKTISKMPIKQSISFFLQKSKNALKLLVNKPPLPAPTVRSTLAKAISIYKPKPYPGNILLIPASEDKHYLKEHGWETAEPGKIQVNNVPTDHDNLLKEPNIELVVSYLKDYLVQ